ncbi:unnamed protein product [Didymodactylos carnosus]|uniref:Uncharacterized protein n=1 Tax=Didymodactylos carnosus TaxID=1234261 RepID=A0A8S2FI47_9BILA|nr:unnamed protein product [Didymodactylos carnosus]CAF4266406.1 unnamed protein product [Didymodactylos carnosus]
MATAALHRMCVADDHEIITTLGGKAVALSDLINKKVGQRADLRDAVGLPSSRASRQPPAREHTIPPDKRLAELTPDVSAKQHSSKKTKQ